MGRPPKKGEKRKKKKEGSARGYDQWAHAAFLKEVVAAARKIQPRGKLKALQDGVALHWAAGCDKIIAKEFEFTRGHPGYSPDLNCVEWSFGMADRQFFKIPAKDAPKKLPETIALYQKTYRSLKHKKLGMEYSLLGLADTQVQRMRDCVAAGGGATRW